MAVGENYLGNDFYCDVAIPGKAGLDVVFEDEHVLAYHHTKPFWQVHIVVVPKLHIPSFTDFGPEHEGHLLAVLAAAQHVARDVERAHGAAAVLTNLGEYQDSKHLHVHVHSGPQVKE